MIKTSQLSCVIDQKTLLKNINVSIATGKIYGLIGHNGSGKSTLIKLLASEMKASDGSVTLDEKNIAAISNKELAKHIAYLPQKLPDANAFTVEELVMLGRYPWQKWLQKPTDDDKKIVLESMQYTQIASKATQMVSTLSGGERARAWLAMCLAQQTKYLLLDEPLSALDIVYQVEILTILKQLVREQNIGVVIIIHDINLASQFCDEFIALKQGEICHTGTVSETMTTDTLHNIFGVQLHLIKHPTHNHKVAVV